MDKPAVVGVDHAEPGTDCSVYTSVINADHWDAPYCALQDLLDLLERQIDEALDGLSMTPTLRCAAILQKNNAFSTTRDRVANLIRVDPRNPNSPFNRGKS